MQQLLAWVTSFTRREQIVNQAVHQLAKIAQQRANSNACTLSVSQREGYQRARLRQTVREYLDTLQTGPQAVSARERQQLLNSILDRLVQQDLIAPTTHYERVETPRQAA